MVMTETALLFLGAFAMLATAGMFLSFDDGWTNVVLGFFAALLWGFFGITSFDVLVVETYYATRSEPIMPFVVLGVGLAGIIALYSIWQAFDQLGDDVDEAEVMGGLT